MARRWDGRPAGAPAFFSVGPGAEELGAGERARQTGM